MKYNLLLLITLLSLNTLCYCVTPEDSLNTTVKSDTLSLSDSLSNNIEMSHAPIIAFGIVGALVGGGIGGAIDPPKKFPEGVFGISISKTGAIGFGIGALIGGYIGYRLTKCDYERELKAQKSRILKNNIKKDKSK